MSAVDPRFPELDLFLQGIRRRLNLRFLAGEALTAALVTAPGALVLSLVGTRDPGLRWALWALATALGALVWGVLRFPRRLNLAQAAAWFDQDQKTRGLFLAAAEVLNRPSPGPLGLAVLAQADRLRAAFRAGSRFRFPRKRLALRAGAAALGTGLCLAVLAAAPPLAGTGIQATVVPAHPQAGGSPAPVPPAPPGGAAAETPRSLAQRLFPEDSRLAALAEQALVSGDPGALDALLQQSQNPAGGKAGAAPSPGRGKSPTGRNPGSAPGEGRAPGSAGGTGDQKGSGPAGETEGQDPNSPPSKTSPGAPGQTGDRSDPSAAPGTQDGRTAGRQGTGSGGSGASGDAPNGAGGAPGTGHSDKPLGNQDDLLSSSRQLRLAEKAAPGVFEFVLPGAGAKVPLTRALVDSRQAAESAVDRSSTPLEFQTTIRSYFLSLSQEASP